MKLGKLPQRVASANLSRLAGPVDSKPWQRKYTARTLQGATRQRARDLVFRRQPICAHCKAEVSQELDHIIPISEGGTDAWENLQGLCITCHKAKTAREQIGRSAKG